MMTTTEVAAEFGTDPKTLRKFLRSDASGIEKVGKGARYSLPSSKRELTALRKRYAKWDEARTAPNTDEAPTAPESDITPDADEAPISLDELEGPTEDDLLESDIDD
jgi:hypothetical protein